RVAGHELQNLERALGAGYVGRKRDRKGVRRRKWLRVRKHVVGQDTERRRMLDGRAGTRVAGRRRHHWFRGKLAPVVDGQRDTVMARMSDDLIDGHRDRLALVKRRHLAGRRPTAFVTAGSELLGKSEAVLRHP